MREGGSPHGYSFHGLRAADRGFPVPGCSPVLWKCVLRGRGSHLATDPDAEDGVRKVRAPAATPHEVRFPHLVPLPALQDPLGNRLHPGRGMIFTGAPVSAEKSATPKSSFHPCSTAGRLSGLASGGENPKLGLHFPHRSDGHDPESHSRATVPGHHSAPDLPEYRAPGLATQFRQECGHARDPFFGPAPRWFRAVTCGGPARAG